MAYAQRIITSNSAGDQEFTFTFDYIKEEHIKVFVNFVEKAQGTGSNEFQVITNTSPKKIRLNTGLSSNNTRVEIKRVSSLATPLVDFEDGSTLTAADLDTAEKQSLFIDQELDDALKQGVSIDASTGIPTLSNQKLSNVADPTNAQDAVTKNYLERSGSISSTQILDGTIQTGDIGADQITGALIPDDAINSEHYAAGSIDNEHLANDAVNGNKIADDSINSEHYVDGSIDTQHIGADQITNALIADDQIDSEHYVDGSIDTQHIADSQITSAKIADGTIVAGDLASNSVTTVKIADGAVTEPKIPSNAVIADKIATGAVIGTKLATDAVTTDKIANANVTTDKITNANVTTDKIADNAVTNAKIAADAVTNAKIADDSIDSEHYVDGSIDTAHIAGAQVTDAKLASNSVTESKITDANVTTNKIANDAVTIGKLGCEQTTISDSDSHIPTSGAVVDYVAAQLAPIGGLEVIATDAAFPNTQPAAGVVISIADAGGLVVNGSGVSTTGRTVGGSTVTINNINSAFNSATVDAGVSFMVSSTGSGQIYNFHKATLKESDILNLSNDINDFGNRYRVTNGEPTSNNDEGDLIYDKNADKMKVFDSTANAFKEVTSTGDFKFLFLCPAGGSGAPTINGSVATYDLRESSNSGAAAAVTSAAQLIVSVNGVIQKANTGTSAPSEGFALVDANTIIFGANLPTGASVFIIQIGSAITVPTPGDGTVSEAKISSGAVTTAKIADDAVTNAKIADNAIENNQLADGEITSAKLASNSVISSKIANQAVQLEHLPHGTSSNDGKFLRANNGADPTFESLPASGVTVSNNADNRVVTGDGTNLNAEANLAFDGSNLSVTGGLDVSSDVKLHSNITVDNMAVQTGGTKNPVVGIPKDQLGVKDDQAYDVTDNGGAIAFSAKYHSNGSFTTMGSIEGVKNNNSSGNYGGNLVFRTRSHGSSNNIGMRLTNDGLCFGTDNAAANALDEYEEGSWSPSGSWTTISAEYIKIGRMVYAGFSLRADTTGSANVEIGGLPFTAANQKSAMGGIAWGLCEYNSTNNWISGFVDENTTTGKIVRGGQNLTFGSGSNNMNNSAFIRGTFIYYAVS